MDLLIVVISVIGGGIAGFLSSLYFWKRDKRLIRPRLSLEESDTEEDFILLGFRNEGGSFAENIRYSVHQGEKKSKVSFDFAIKPNACHGRIPSSVGDHFYVSVTYEDVFGKTYSDAWEVNHPTSSPDGKYPRPAIATAPQ